MPSPKVIDFASYLSSRTRPSVEADHRPDIILVGQDRDLLRLREQLLAIKGLKIRSMICGEAANEIRSPQSRVWIFCSTIDLLQLIHLVSTVRRFSQGSRLLLLEGPNSSEFCAPLFHRIVRLTDGVDELLRAVEELSIDVRGTTFELGSA